MSQDEIIIISDSFMSSELNTACLPVYREDADLQPEDCHIHGDGDSQYVEQVESEDKAQGECYLVADGKCYQGADSGNCLQKPAALAVNGKAYSLADTIANHASHQQVKNHHKRDKPAE